VAGHLIDPLNTEALHQPPEFEGRLLRRHAFALTTPAEMLEAPLCHRFTLSLTHSAELSATKSLKVYLLHDGDEQTALRRRLWMRLLTDPRLAGIISA
jgi:hypothetical protein